MDPKQIIEIRELIRNLAKQHTVILSSHILAEVREVCDYIMIISKGKLVASDTPENLEYLMAGNDTVELEVKAKDKEVLEILNSFKSISEWNCEENADGNLDVMIKVKDREDIREELFFAFTKADCPILGMRKTKVSLEQVFLELTEGESEDDSNL